MFGIKENSPFEILVRPFHAIHFRSRCQQSLCCVVSLNGEVVEQLHVHDEHLFLCLNPQPPAQAANDCLVEPVRRKGNPIERLCYTSLRWSNRFRGNGFIVPSKP